MRVAPKILLALLLTVVGARAQTEAARDACIQGRRLICGRIVAMHHGGLIVDCGYTNLLTAPLNKSWLQPSTIAAIRDPHLVEARKPDAICAGEIYLVDTPKRGRKPALYDYVSIRAYPAGSITIETTGRWKKTLRRFSCGLETALRLSPHSSR